MQKAEDVGSVKSEEELLHCPICFKTFICKYGLESHMETHPDTTLKWVDILFILGLHIVVKYVYT